MLTEEDAAEVDSVSVAPLCRPGGTFCYFFPSDCERKRQGALVWSAIW
jgi:hypothetical protein